MLRHLAILVLVSWTLSDDSSTSAADVSFSQEADRLIVRMGEQPVAEYVFRDDQVLRPYFRHLRTPSGVQVTRTHPPVEGVDLDDHATMHPGLWMAFGDLGGADFWRNKGRVRHERFIEPPQAGADGGLFVVSNVYEADGKAICREDCRVKIEPVPTGYLLRWTSTFTPTDGEFAFGDQEEMGLGVRVATPLAVKNGGEMINSEGRRNEAEVWGRPADWCAYRGSVDGTQVGIVIMPHPDNFRRSWFHARDYGLLLANPFGRKAFTKGEPSRVVVEKNEPLTLRFGVFVYDAPNDKSPDLASIYRRYIGE